MELRPRLPLQPGQPARDARVPACRHGAGGSDRRNVQLVQQRKSDEFRYAALQPHWRGTVAERDLHAADGVRRRLPPAGAADRTDRAAIQFLSAMKTMVSRLVEMGKAPAERVVAGA